MAFRWLAFLAAGAVALGPISPASAYLFWSQPKFAGTPVQGDEPGLGLPMPKATPAELKAHMLWNLRAGLNVAARQKDFDSYTTKTYNGFSTMHAQLGFCETASAIGGDARKLGRGRLTQLALERMRELRNSLVPVGDMINSKRAIYVTVPAAPSMDKRCWTKKDLLKASCAVSR